MVNLERKKLTDKEKVDFLEKVLTTLFGWGSKIDWEQDFLGRRKITIRNVDLSYDDFAMVSSLRNHFELELEGRAYIEESEEFYLPDKDGDITTFIEAKVDLALTEQDYYDLVRTDPEFIEKIRKNYEHTSWTDEDREKYEHHAIKKGQGERAKYFGLSRFKPKKEEKKDERENT